MDKRPYLWSGLLFIFLARNMGGSASPQTTDLLAILAASIPLRRSPAAPIATVHLPTSVFNLFMHIPSTLSVPISSSY